MRWINACYVLAIALTLFSGLFIGKEIGEERAARKYAEREITLTPSVLSGTIRTPAGHTALLNTKGVLKCQAQEKSPTRRPRKP